MVRELAMRCETKVRYTGQREAREGGPQRSKRAAREGRMPDKEGGSHTMVSYEIKVEKASSRFDAESGV